VPELTRVLAAAASDRVRLLRASAAAHAARVAAAAASDAELTARAAEFDAAELSRRRAEFVVRLAEVRTLAAESQGLLRAGIQRLVAETSQQAADAAPAAIVAALTAADQWMAAHPGLGGPDVESGARQAGLDAAAGEVAVWRDRRSSELDRDLTALSDRLEQRLAEQLQAVAAAAAHSFELAGGPPPPTGRLISRSSFRLTGADQAGSTDLLAAAVRSRLPGRFGRRRIVAHLHDDLTRTVERQFGRARADFQARLQASGRQLAAASKARIADATRRIEDAVDRGGRLAALQATDRERAVAAESSRGRTLHDLAVRLTDGLAVAASYR
jgi:hypothetical protein